jgi:hypothetical protein
MKQRFKVGDEVFLTDINKPGTVIRAWTESLPNAPPGTSEMPHYDIRLDTGQVLTGVYSGIEPAKTRE